MIVCYLDGEIVGRGKTKDEAFEFAKAHAALYGDELDITDCYFKKEVSIK